MTLQRKTALLQTLTGRLIATTFVVWVAAMAAVTVTRVEWTSRYLAQQDARTCSDVYIQWNLDLALWEAKVVEHLDTYGGTRNRAEAAAGPVSRSVDAYLERCDSGLAPPQTVIWPAEPARTVYFFDWPFREWIAFTLIPLAVLGLSLTLVAIWRPGTVGSAEPDA